MCTKILSCSQVAERLTVPPPSVFLRAAVQLKDEASVSVTFEITFPGGLPGGEEGGRLATALDRLLASANTLAGFNVSVDQNGHRGLLPASKP